MTILHVRKLIFLVVLSASFWPTRADAIPMTWLYTGTVTNVSHPTSVDVGAPASIYLTYDPDDNRADPSIHPTWHGEMIDLSNERVNVSHRLGHRARGPRSLTGLRARTGAPSPPLRSVPLDFIAQRLGP